MKVKKLDCAVTASLLICMLPAVAQEHYPTKPLKIVVPYSAGTSSDTFSRMLAKELEPKLGQPVMVETRPGGNSTLGAAYVAKSAPDGYTMLWAGPSAISAAKAMFKSLSYDPINDFAAVNIYAEAYFTFMVGAEEKRTTFAQYLDKMRNDPKRNSIGGFSSTVEIISHMINKAAKTGHIYVRYSQATNMATDAISGRLGAALHSIPQTAPLVKGGKAHVLAVTSPVSLPSFPDAPPIASTLPGVSLGSFNGYFVPAKTPRPIVATLHRHMAETFKLPQFVARAEGSGRMLHMTPAEADTFVRSEEKRWTILAKEAGLQPE